MIIYEQERKTILESMYTDEEIRMACSNDPKIYKQVLKKKRERIESLVKCIYAFET